MSANLRCVLHELAGSIKPAAFVYQGYSLCGRCVRGTARDILLLDQTMEGLVRDALEEGRTPPHVAAHRSRA